MSSRILPFGLTIAILLNHAFGQQPGNSTSPSQLLKAGGIEFVFATAKQGRELLGRPDSYTSELSPFDRQVRTRKAEDPGTEDFLSFISSQVLDWPDDERRWATTAIKSLVKPIQKLGINLDEPVMLVHTMGQEESGAAYTRGKTIVVPRGQNGSQEKPPKKLMAHELFHVLSRSNPKLRDQLYATIGFQRATPIRLPKNLEPLKITNPDAPVIQHVIELKLDPIRSVKVAPVLFSKSKFNPNKKAGLFGYLSFRLLEVEKVNNRWVPKMENSEPIFHSPATPDFQRQIGRNTGYIIHPEEVLADNFALLLLDGEAKDPWVIEAMKEALANEFNSSADTGAPQSRLKE